MEIELTVRAKEDLEYWKKAGNQRVLKRIRELSMSIFFLAEDITPKTFEAFHSIGNCAKNPSLDRAMCNLAFKQKLHNMA